MTKKLPTSPVNQKYLSEWDNYAALGSRTHPLLMPINIDIDNGILVRERMKAWEVKKIFARCRGDFPSYMAAAPDLFDCPRTIVDDYVRHFDPIDGVEGPHKTRTPLDINIAQPIWLMVNLPRENWKFSEKQQYSVENDRDDQCRNYQKICMLDDRNVLILENRNRSNPKGLKFNFHVCIYQTSDGVEMGTDIIIDPGGNNNPTPPFTGGGD